MRRSQFGKQPIGFQAVVDATRTVLETMERVRLGKQRKPSRQRPCISFTALDLLAVSSAGAIFGAPMSMGHDTNHSLHLATQLWTAEITRQHSWAALHGML